MRGVRSGVTGGFFDRCLLRGEGGDMCWVQWYPAAGGPPAPKKAGEAVWTSPEALASPAKSLGGAVRQQLESWCCFHSGIVDDHGHNMNVA